MLMWKSSRCLGLGKFLLISASKTSNQEKWKCVKNVTIRLVESGRRNKEAKGGQRKVSSMTKSDRIVTNIAISVNNSALLVPKHALSVQK